MKFLNIESISKAAYGVVLGMALLSNSYAQSDLASKITVPNEAQWIPMIPEMGTKGPAFAIVFGKPGVMGQPFGGMFRVPAGGESPSHTHTSAIQPALPDSGPKKLVWQWRSVGVARAAHDR